MSGLRDEVYMSAAFSDTSLTKKDNIVTIFSRTVIYELNLARRSDKTDLMIVTPIQSRNHGIL